MFFLIDAICNSNSVDVNAQFRSVHKGFDDGVLHLGFWTLSTV
jgi:hypothetical protein